MIFKSLEIQSYRSCIETNFEIQEDLTALTGLNGSGKTNILSALLLLKEVYSFNGISHYKENDSFSNICKLKITFEHNSKPISAIIKISYLIDENNTEEIKDVKIKWDFSKITDVAPGMEFPKDFFNNERYYRSREDRKRFEQLFIERAVNIYKLKFSAQQLRNTYPFAKTILTVLSGISYYSASYSSDPSKCPNFIEIEKDKPIRNFRALRQHENFIIDLYKSFRNKNQTKFKLYLSTINKLGVGLVDDIKFDEVPIASNYYKVMSGGKVRTTEKERLLIIPHFIIDKNSLSPNQLSEGTFRTLALLFYILTDESKILLIEEPEIGIHHGLLSSIMSIIQSQSKVKQIIISTHSDFILDQLSTNNVVLVNRSPTLGTTTKPLSKSMSEFNYAQLKRYLAETGNLGEYLNESSFFK